MAHSARRRRQPGWQRRHVYDAARRDCHDAISHAAWRQRSGDAVVDRWPRTSAGMNALKPAPCAGPLARGAIACFFTPVPAPPHRGSSRRGGGRRAASCGCWRGSPWRSLLQRAAVFEIRGDPGRPEAMVADLGLDAGGLGAAADHRVGVGLGQGGAPSARRCRGRWSETAPRRIVLQTRSPPYKSRYSSRV